MRIKKKKTEKLKKQETSGMKVNWANTMKKKEKKKEKGVLQWQTEEEKRRADTVRRKQTIDFWS